MTDEELKKKCTERAKIFQQAMESCKSSSPMDCIEWFADRIAELEKENAELKNKLEHRNCLDCSNHSSKLRMRTLELEKENAELKKHLKCLITGMYHIAQHHPTMGAHTKIMQDLTEAEQFISEVEK